ncbi:hypothetical protein EVAR_49786_1 [Eumeta japonica]|uniref:Uncharacterized protein n=1 Tax=Eumeta variegata TaxID=151549 RepID=A0A4C1Y585_EUMVA|nr:hypothetical protein EVAR_49786_1 [Eumeta japonica]
MTSEGASSATISLGGREPAPQNLYRARARSGSFMPARRFHSVAHLFILYLLGTRGLYVPFYRAVRVVAAPRVTLRLTHQNFLRPFRAPDVLSDGTGEINSLSSESPCFSRDLAFLFEFMQGQLSERDFCYRLIVINSLSTLEFSYETVILLHLIFVHASIPVEMDKSIKGTKLNIVQVFILCGQFQKLIVRPTHISQVPPDHKKFEDKKSSLFLADSDLAHHICAPACSSAPESIWLLYYFRARHIFLNQVQVCVRVACDAVSLIL